MCRGVPNEKLRRLHSWVSRSNGRRPRAPGRRNRDDGLTSRAGKCGIACVRSNSLRSAFVRLRTVRVTAAASRTAYEVNRRLRQRSRESAEKGRWYEFESSSTAPFEAVTKISRRLESRSGRATIVSQRGHEVGIFQRPARLGGRCRVEPNATAGQSAPRPAQPSSVATCAETIRRGRRS